VVATRVWPVRPRSTFGRRWLEAVVGVLPGDKDVDLACTPTKAVGGVRRRGSAVAWVLRLSSAWGLGRRVGVSRSKGDVLSRACLGFSGVTYRWPVGLVAGGRRVLQSSVPWASRRSAVPAGRWGCGGGEGGGVGVGGTCVVAASLECVGGGPPSGGGWGGGEARRWVTVRSHGRWYCPDGWALRGGSGVAGVGGPYDGAGWCVVRVGGGPGARRAGSCICSNPAAPHPAGSVVIILGWVRGVRGGRCGRGLGGV